jgi:ATP-dependent DNA helicase RecQ
MNTPCDILRQYWGYSGFRPLQEEIINSALEGNDTLALLPTGGGKSICFQVPALMRDGICIVITPLIALMKDQVEQLKRRKIPAVAVYSGMNYREIDIVLDNCVYGSNKFLYISPERLKTDLFQARAKKMKIGLLAVDEAHCISQWGYDFRPSYLDIADFRKIVPDVNIIALTATATKPVRADIQDKLLFRNGKVFQKSFARSNLAYVVKWQENKDKKLVEALKSVGGSAIVYVRNRKRTKEIAQFLLANRINADYYHAGLNNQERSTKQDAWIAGHIRTIVSTNAFGMGIDKPDVRIVVHMDLPENLEAYYQEAGRAGRDEKKSYAAILANEHDLKELRERVEKSYPPVDFLKKVYQCLANYFKIAVGSNLLSSYDFNIRDFSNIYNLDMHETYNAIKKLEHEGFVQLNESFFNPSRIFVPGGKKSLYEFQIAHADYDLFIKNLLRLYGGEIFSGFVNISENQVSKLIHEPEETVVRMLDYLHKSDVILYEKQKDQPQITFLTSRFDANKLPLDIKGYSGRRATELSKMEAVINYVRNNVRCRSLQLLEYFDEVSYLRCGICDVCLDLKKAELSEQFFKAVRERILNGIENQPSIEKILGEFKVSDKDQVLEVLRKMLDNREIRMLESGRIDKINR